MFTRIVSNGQSYRVEGLSWWWPFWRVLKFPIQTGAESVGVVCYFSSAKEAKGFERRVKPEKWGRV
jgi:hypothetical protein